MTKRLVSHKCIVLQPIEKKVVNSKRTFWINVEADFEQLEITSDMLPNLLMFEVVNVPPALAKWKLGGVPHPDAAVTGCFLMPKYPDRTTDGIKQFAASRAYHNATLAQMQDICAIIKAPKPTSKLVGTDAWARHLMSHELTTWSAEQIDQAIIEWRGHTKKRQVVEVMFFGFHTALSRRLAALNGLVAQPLTI